MISEILEEYFSEQSRSPYTHNTVYPTQSSAYINHGSYQKLEGKCMRASFYNCMGIPEEEEHSLRTQLIFKMGDAAEDMLLALLEKKGVLFDSQTKFLNEKYNISGRTDGILKIKDQKVGLEIKSIGGNNSYAVNAIWGSKWGKAAPKWQNLFQTLVYCYVFRDEIDEFILLYIRRDTCEIKEFVISIQPKDGKMYACIDGVLDERYCVDDILARYGELKTFVDNKELPPREYFKVYPMASIPTYVRLGIISKRQAEKYSQEPFGDFECRYCNYTELCDKNETGSIEEDD